jgi:hypothetical protein
VRGADQPATAGGQGEPALDLRLEARRGGEGLLELGRVGRLQGDEEVELAVEMTVEGAGRQPDAPDDVG